MRAARTEPEKRTWSYILERSSDLFPWESRFHKAVENIFHAGFRCCSAQSIYHVFKCIHDSTTGPKVASFRGSQALGIEEPDSKGMDLMRLLLKILIGGVVLLTAAFAQEPKHAVVAKEPVTQSGASTAQVISTGSPERPAPIVQPKALPPLNPSLGEIARKARAAHAEAPKAQLVVAEDAPPKEEKE